MQTTAPETVTLIKDCLQAGLVPMIAGDAGIGKSDIVYQVFNSYKLKLIDIRLSQYDPTELNGYPAIKKERATHIPLDTFPLEDTPLPKNYNGWGIFFDEFNSANLAVQAAAYKIVLDRCIGQYTLNKKTAIVCAGNLITSNAIVQRMSTAMQSRLIHAELVVDINSWVQWANLHKIDHRIIAYLQNVPTNLHNFQPNHDDKTFACP